ncbi:MAG TPA: hypothetical protein VGE18_01050 [Candidatus Paceibacterota bacterium]
MITIAIIVLCLIGVIVYTCIYFLIPLPFLSYQQGSPETDYGKVTEIKKIRPGVFEIGLALEAEIDSDGSQDQIQQIVSASFTRFFHFRKGQPLPKMGDSISVLSINRFHHFTGRSFNWVDHWRPHSGHLPTGGTAKLVTS